MQRYVLNLWEPVGPPPPPELLEPVMERVGALDREMRDAGVWLFAGGLHQPEASTVLRPQDGEVLVTDGPFLEGKEHLGGFTLIDVDDLDAALGWGRRLTEATGLPVEVRPFRHGGRG
jgi:hypothetical protein